MLDGYALIVTTGQRARMGDLSVGEQTIATRRFSRGLAGCLAMVLALSVALNWPMVASGHPNVALMTSGGDIAEQVWFLGWLPHALLHGHNPFFSSALYAGSGGVNLMSNTSVFFPALVLMPVTLLGGPILAFNIGVLFTPVVCAWPMYVLARRLSASWTLATVATVLWVLSPYVVSNLAQGHFHQTVTFFPPLVVLLAWDLIDAKRSVVATGIFGGLAVVAQYFTGSELLAMTALEVALGLLVLLVVKRAVLIANWKASLRSLLVASSVASALLCYPLWMEFFGPRHTTGSPWGEHYDLGVILKGVVVAPFGLGHGDRLSRWVSGTDVAQEPLFFLGVGLVVSAVATAVLRFSDPKVRALTLVAIITFVASLGVSVRLGNDGSLLSSWAPWQLVNHLPLFEQLIPSRLAQPVGFAVVLLALLGAEAAREQLGAAKKSIFRLFAVVGIGVVVMPQVLAANAPFPTTTDQKVIEPAFFKNYGQSPGPNARLLVFPYPAQGAGIEPASMTYQALADYSYDLVGGYVLVPTTGSTASIWKVPPTGGEGLLRRFIGPFSANNLSVAERQLLARTMVERGTTTVALAPILNDQHLAAAALAATMGTAPHEFDGVLWWSVSNKVTPLDVSPEVVRSCATTTSSLPLIAAATCVLDAAKLRP